MQVILTGVYTKVMARKTSLELDEGDTSDFSPRNTTLKSSPSMKVSVRRGLRAVGGGGNTVQMWVWGRNLLVKSPENHTRATMNRLLLAS